MPRKPMLIASTGKMLQELSIASVMNVLPREMVEHALEETGTNSIRKRDLPADMVVYLVIMLALNSDASVQENLRVLMEPLRREFGVDNTKVPCGAATTRARKKLGASPLVRLFDEMAHPIASPETPGCFYKNFRTVAVDGTTANIQETSANCERFGIHTNQFGKVGYPQVRAVVMVECGTRNLLGCEYGGGNESEHALFSKLVSKLKKDMLLLADRLYYSFDRWRECSERAGALLWRVCSNLKLEATKHLDDGSYLAEVRPSKTLIRKGKCKASERATVRVIEYRPVFEDDEEGETIRVVTTLLDVQKYPADELAQLYSSRWDSETGFDEIKTHLRGPDRVLRSQLPELVEQELYGYLLAYTVIRRTIFESAKMAKCPPRELSFMHAVRVIRRKLVFFPSEQS